jgi:HD-like signal output (HDOD) protein
LEHWLTGLDHAQLGGRIAEKWNLPPILVEAIAYHHEPARATTEPHVTYWVHLADAAALMLGISLGYDGLCYELNEEVIIASGFEELDMEGLMEVELKAVADAEGIFQEKAEAQ